MYFGKIDIAFTVDPSGKVVDPRIVSSNLHLDGEKTLPQSQYDKVFLESVSKQVFPKSRHGCLRKTSVWIN
jgi:16S rRNA A1518/A1519 N6-dimethyltransferase RsmA/KsgA/DIM1 with predicted DNA glycosylase/AP lyase activity